MSFNYTMNISQQIDGSPQVVFEMSSGDAGLPCFQNVGSCTYNMCNGTNSLEEQISAPWSNECPIAPDSYQNELNVKIPSLAGLFIENSTVHVKIESVNDGEELGCVEFDITVEGAEDDSD
ncbi:uncharacterized protein [Dermacentor andersoni]|uniref:uncharacterized protein n=1 Tax=Dermacentor andersoni TaxID=34620 RepID=UPI0024171826|nr:uncharacterized protein LOC129380314 [Dermacentor andersoni]